MRPRVRCDRSSSPTTRLEVLARAAPPWVGVFHPPPTAFEPTLELRTKGWRSRAGSAPITRRCPAPLRLGPGRGSARRNARSAGGESSPACSGRSPPLAYPAFRGRGRVRSGRSGRPVTARASRGTPPPPPRSAGSAGTRSRVPHESTLFAARAAWPSRAPRSLARRVPFAGARVLVDRGRRSRSCPLQIGKILLNQVKRIRQIAGLPDLDRDNRMPVVDCRLEGLLELVGRPVEAEPFRHLRADSPEWRARPWVRRILVSHGQDGPNPTSDRVASRARRRVRADGNRAGCLRCGELGGEPGEIPAAEKRVRCGDDERSGCASRQCTLHRVGGTERRRLPNAPHFDTKARPVSRQLFDLLGEVAGDE